MAKQNKEQQVIEQEDVGGMAAWDGDGDDASLGSAQPGDDTENSWDDWSEEDAKQEERELKQKQIEQIPEGLNMYRFLPRKKAPNADPNIPRKPILKIWQHYVKEPGKEQGNAFVHVCGRQHPESLPEGQEDCMTCVVAERLGSLKGMPLAKALEDDLAPGLRGFAVAKKMDPNTYEYLPTPPVIVSMPPVKVVGKLVKLRSNQHAGGNFVDPIHGWPVIIERTGTGKMNSDFDVYAGADRRALPLPDLSEMRRIPELDDMKKAPDANRLEESLLKVLKMVLPQAAAFAIMTGKPIPQPQQTQAPQARAMQQQARPAAPQLPQQAPQAKVAPKVAPQPAQAAEVPKKPKKTIQQALAQDD